MLEEDREIIESRLPEELEKDIFELASWDDRPTGYTLIRVAKRVHEWIEPSLYRVFVICDGTYPSEDVIPSSLFLPSFTERLAEAGPTAISRQAKFVRHFMYTGQDISPFLDLILPCTNIVDLAVWTFPGSSNKSLETLTTFLGTLHLERLSISAELVQLYPRCLSPLAQSLTHLDCFGMHGPFWDDGLETLSLSRLTHFAVAGAKILPTIRAVLKESKTIQLVINTQDDISNLDVPEAPWCPKDPRFIFCEYPLQPTACWLKGTIGGDDIWVLGEEAQRRQTQRLPNS